MKRSKKLLLGLGILVAGCGLLGDSDVKGSAKLPDCSETPAADLSGVWFDRGTVTITSDGCEGVESGAVLQSCSLNWEFSQSGNDIEIVVDNEYSMKGRMCGETLYLEGGWWLPVEDEGECNYADDDGDEVGIEEGGSSLTYSVNETQDESLTGTLLLKGSCTGEYEIELQTL